METWMITGVTGFLGPRVEVTLREKGEVEVLPMTREELSTSSVMLLPPIFT